MKVTLVMNVPTFDGNQRILMLSYLSVIQQRKSKMLECRKMSLCDTLCVWHRSVLVFSWKEQPWCGYLLPLFLASERSADSPQRQGVETWPVKQTASCAYSHLPFPGIHFVYKITLNFRGAQTAYFLLNYYFIVYETSVSLSLISVFPETQHQDESCTQPGPIRLQGQELGQPQGLMGPADVTGEREVVRNVLRHSFPAVQMHLTQSDPPCLSQPHLSKFFSTKTSLCSFCNTIKQTQLSFILPLKKKLKCCLADSQSIMDPRVL